ncbi:MAG: phospholipase D-like domain-containing protein [Candidatus Woesearchaeota archaeon]
MHHKVFIIDEKVVVTGSFNPSSNADKNNDENLLIIHDPIVAAEFLEEFERVWGEAGE